MSKYIKLEDAIKKIERVQGVICGTTLFADLPTIEVSEDCISREWLVNRFKDIVEHYEMRIRRAKRYGKKTTYDTSGQIGCWKDEIADYKYFIREIEKAPSVVPKRCEMMGNAIKAAFYFLQENPSDDVIEAAKIQNLSSMGARLNELLDEAYYKIKINHKIGWYQEDDNPLSIASRRLPVLITRMYVSRDYKGSDQ